MSLERDAEKLQEQIDRQGGTPTTGQALLSGCLGVALVIKAVLVLALVVFMLWFLWACASAREEGAGAAAMITVRSELSVSAGPDDEGPLGPFLRQGRRCLHEPSRTGRTFERGEDTCHVGTPDSGVSRSLFLPSQSYFSSS